MWEFEVVKFTKSGMYLDREDTKLPRKDAEAKYLNNVTIYIENKQPVILCLRNEKNEMIKTQRINF